jgi:hypothetical protein
MEIRSSVLEAVMFPALGMVEVSATPYLLTILAAFALCLLTFAVFALVDSSAETWPVRALQRGRLRASRMHRMLKRRHVDVAAYARSLDVIELKQQLQKCRDCGLSGLCDRALKSRAPSRSVFSFCPNRPAIEHYLVERAPVSA